PLPVPPRPPLFPYTTLFRSPSHKQSLPITTSIASISTPLSVYIPESSTHNSTMPIPVPAADSLHDLFSLKGKTVVVTGASGPRGDRKSTRLNSSHVSISYAV